MRKGIRYVLAAAAIIVGSCSKDEDPTPGFQFAASPEAKAEHDSKSGGVYKGAFGNATTSGNLKAVLQEGKSEIQIAYEGETRTLLTTDLSGWTSGEAIVADFTSGNWSVQLISNSTGTSFTFDFALAGVVDFDAVIIKENSTAQVFVYEGTYTGDGTGIWNICTKGNAVAGFHTGTTSGYLEGTFTGSAISMTQIGGVATAVGTFNSDKSSCSGTWEDSGFTGTWSGARKH